MGYSEWTDSPKRYIPEALRTLRMALVDLKERAIWCNSLAIGDANLYSESFLDKIDETIVWVDSHMVGAITESIEDGHYRRSHPTEVLLKVWDIPVPENIKDIYRGLIIESLKRVPNYIKNPEEYRDTFIRLTHKKFS